MYIYSISKQEQFELNELLDNIYKSFDSAEDESFILQSPTYADDLPKGIKKILYKLRNTQCHDGALMIRGYSSNRQVLPTPKSWHLKDSYKPDFDSDFLAIIFSSILGEPFGFATQQKGKLIHDILPIKGEENHQAGSSSLAELNFHTEDAFHPYRADYICLTCLKNPVNTGTLGVGIHELELPDDIKKILMEKRFYTLTDNTHAIELSEVPFHSILFGHVDNPYICIDYDFTFPKEDDPQAKHAFEFLINEIRSKIHEIQVEPGDFYFLDNYKWLHGRKSFKAEFDGHDRWLRRFNIKKDLKEAVNYRIEVHSRMLTAEPIY
jgi:hypothetical protein